MEPQPPQIVPASKLHFIFRNDRGLRAGWRLLIFAGMLVSFFMLVTLVLSGMRGAQPRTQQNVINPWPQLVVGVFVFLAVLFFTWVMSRIERRPMGVYGLPLNRSLFKSFLWGWIFWGVLPLTALLLVMRALGVFYFGTIALHGADVIRFALLWGAVFLLVGLVEEYVTRGYALYTLADGIGFWPAAILQALLFGYGHMGNPGETRIGIVDATLFAVFAAVTLRLTGSLWLAVGAHAGWDWAQSFLYGVNDSGAPAVGHFLNSHSQGPAWLSGGTVGPEGSVLSSLMMMAMTAAFIAIYGKRRRPEAATRAEDRPPLPPS
ncbi:MAG TPA: CPBP family intramembrane glutamic endopeptidase [Candidatus Angelobacter sp.]|nr:CPBP family intramembrane glutamic endopeptidase [Candidatus Angelobacter sp.]